MACEGQKASHGGSSRTAAEATPSHGSEGELRRAAGDKGFSSLPSLTGILLWVTPKLRFHRRCPPTQIPARQPRNHPSCASSKLRAGPATSPATQKIRGGDKPCRVSCYFAFQRVNKRLIQWEERKTSSKTLRFPAEPATPSGRAKVSPRYGERDGYRGGGWMVSAGAAFPALGAQTSCLGVIQPLHLRDKENNY